ncbi:UbiA family prenyltransferase [Bacteriovorax sp. DB6_IX]|uniref:UbiA family prenyltransferase n=1 Tax=Bacteriovorax sp. DB6_IX TaxID=1353530 RepID=UPI00038A49D1|nr:UbiA family prenyltransferase [Bacteriovorax sp. DB6_IX]EQC43150.1 prenyltransferase, UbiA family [Bacteriovorax sp. DB6_IX]
MINRIGIYLKEMFPPLHFIGTYLFTIILAAAVCSIKGDYSFIKDPTIHLVALAVVLLSLMVRIMDEFKDYEDDLKNYPNRPLPSGRVKKGDLKVLQSIVIPSILLLCSFNLNVFIAALICLAYGGLMYKWFFMEERMRKSLPLAFATHNPVIIVKFGLICTVLFERGYVDSISSTLIGIPLMLTMTNWEISRKIRAPKDETEYTTYSKIWGPKVAASVALFIQILVFAGVMSFLINYNHHLLIVAIYLLVATYFAWQYINFIRTLSHKSTFKAHAENLALGTQLTVLFAAVIKFI